MVRFETRLVLLAVLAATPLLAVLVAALLINDADALWWSLTGGAVVLAAIVTYYLHEAASYPLRTIAGVISAIREEDYSMRIRGATADDALGELLAEVNALAEELREERLGSLEAAALVRAIIGHLDSAIFAFDDDLRLRLINRSGESLLGVTATDVVGSRVDEIGLADAFVGEELQTLNLTFGGVSGRWRIHRSQFREKGKPHYLLVMSDLSRALREEELLAWQRLVRVLSHELNNSLAPITSIANSLSGIVSRDPLPDDWREDSRRGLAIISSRADALTRFTDAYARLAKLPRPTPTSVEIESLLRHVVELETRVQVELLPGPATTIVGDRDQLEQALINIVRNAADAAIETGGGVAVSWRRGKRDIEIIVSDEGAGLSGSLNLFVPFFTTKRGGTGIGLVLSRQIADAHGGALSLRSRTDRSGCEASLKLPFRPPPVSARP